MSVNVYHILHVSSLFLLIGVTFAAFAHPDPKCRKQTLMASGILALLALVGGFGLLAKLHYELATGWVLVKLVAWLDLAAVSGLVYRKPDKRGVFALVAAVMVVVAVTMVYLKPF